MCGLTEAIVEFDAGYGVLVALVDAGTLPKLRHPWPTGQIRAASVHDPVDNLKQKPIQSREQKNSVIQNVHV